MSCQCLVLFGSGQWPYNILSLHRYDVDTIVKEMVTFLVRIIYLDVQFILYDIEHKHKCKGKVSVHYYNVKVKYLSYLN